MPLPMGILEVLSSEAARWHGAAAMPERPFAAPLTLDRYATLNGACLSTAYVALRRHDLSRWELTGEDWNPEKVTTWELETYLPYY